MKTFSMILLLAFGATQLHSQVELEELEPVAKRCASLANIQQECNEDGTVSLTFRISNNGRCNASAVSVFDGIGWGQSFFMNLPSQTVSALQLTYSGAIPGSTKCFTIVLWSEGRECCRVTQCIKVTEDCCTLEAPVVSITPTSCYGNDGEAVIVITGGNPSPDYTLEWENTTGSGDGYEEYTQQDGGNGAELTNLTAGTWQYTVTDQNDCEVIGTFVIEGGDSYEAEVTTTPDDCNENGNGTAQIDITGGTPPYTGSYSGPGGGSFSGLSPINLSGLSSGTYYYYITDAEGCNISGTFKVEDENGPGDCEAFEAIMATEADADWNGGCWSTTITSTVSATITVYLDGATEPDEVEVSINGSTQETWTAGSDPCDDQIYGDYYETGHVEYRSFDIEPCNVVEIEVCGNACVDPAYTVWTLTVECDQDGIGDARFAGNDDRPNRQIRTTAEAIAQEMAAKNQSITTSVSGSLRVFPNPVKDVINVTNYNTDVNYKTVRIFDNSGKTILTKNMSDMFELEIDASTLQLGLYYIEIEDEHGNRVIEKMIKAN